MPAIVSSVARSRKSFTGRPPLAFESCAASMPQRSAGNLLPKPPPMYSILTWMLVAGTFEARAEFAAYGGNGLCGWPVADRVALPLNHWPCGSRQQCVMTGIP